MSGSNRVPLSLKRVGKHSIGFNPVRRINLAVSGTAEASRFLPKLRRSFANRDGAHGSLNDSPYIYTTWFSTSHHKFRPQRFQIRRFVGATGRCGSRGIFSVGGRAIQTRNRKFYCTVSCYREHHQRSSFRGSARPPKLDSTCPKLHQCSLEPEIQRCLSLL